MPSNKASRRPSSPAASKPKNWPSHMPYLTAPLLAPTLSPAALTLLRSRAAAPHAIILPAAQPQGPCPLVKITPIASPSHPAKGQSGLFAARHLKPGTLILAYLGAIHGPSGPADADANADGNSDYDLALDRDAGLAIDAARAGNEARFINDYRGVAPRPNAEFRDAWDPARRLRGVAVCVLPPVQASNGKAKPKSKGIAKGEEILVSYGRGFWSARRGTEKESKGELQGAESMMKTWVGRS
ncbi:MAG: hypothetical protein M1818_006070 [Claussenomyces sp. TS43310]|nr:MAG: hypothetical protein M1818_006070 [Claussenomyces sp. TS43310]